MGCGAGITPEPVGEIGVACLIVELETPLKMIVGGGKIAEMKAGGA